MPTFTPAPPPPRGARISGLGVYRPSRVVPNAEIAERLGVFERQLARRSGIRHRRFAEPHETLTAMAAATALKRAGVDAADLGCAVVATTTHLSQMPSAATAVLRELGGNGVAGFDILAACAGFPYAVGLARDMVAAGSAEHVLVVGAERISDILDHDDPATAFLFGDGAGAVVVSAADRAAIGPVVWGSDVDRPDAVGMTGRWVPELRADPALPWPRLGMVGWKVYRWATTELAPAARLAVARAGLTLDDIDAFIPHQANMLVTDALVRQLGLGAHVAVARDIAESGNTSSASIPLAMEALSASGAVRPGQRALCIGFGSGLVYAAQVVDIP
ncbi:3-oxoacyl-[acyl-carrier-protein] synthase-3 [Streptomonospora nanhaiensis]|uniref:3-oxoacyl-[acyl-carrier-protein] synthase-3 n=1 Tax=Streptomonospora nanhaiensis TaxID=1323731 RepID=A0A853BI94_9ACTN|nr:beta-ketoacyl-ACP synthase 3 [Streptomonospora nanhaiensis]NYI94740.1 3-oxoacyl-[acyl-carrier-protein] synthase-3 [Streptomonospora nanhaiensis]